MKRGCVQNIFLTGPKHSGKTSAGKALAALCGCDFFDLDVLIEKHTGKSPRALYRESAEIFQKAETETLRALVETNGTKDSIIAAGGGLIDNPEALELFKNSGTISVYLEVAANTAWNRISVNRELPPFLQTENPQETHRLLHERRAAAYRQFAELTINAEGKSPQQIAEEIFTSLF